MLIKKSNNKKHIDIETLKKILLKTSITYFWTDGSPVESTEKEIHQTFYQVYYPRKYMTEMTENCSLSMFNQLNYLTSVFMNFLLKKLHLIIERQDIFLWCGIGQL